MVYTGFSPQLRSLPARLRLVQVVSSGEVCSCFRAKQSFLGLVRSEIARNTRTCTMEDLTACFLAGSSTVVFSVSIATFWALQYLLG